MQVGKDLKELATVGELPAQSTLWKLQKCKTQGDREFLDPQMLKCSGRKR